MDSDSPLRYRILWLVIGWGLIVTVIILSIMPSPPSVGGSDKLHHFIAYGALMGWFGQLYHATRARSLCFAGFVALGITLEIIQGLGGVRYFEYGDMAANTLGAVIGWTLSRGGGGALLGWLERRLP